MQILVQAFLRGWNRQGAGSEISHIPRQTKRCCVLLGVNHKITIYSFILQESLFLSSYLSHTVKYHSKIIRE